MIRVQYSRQHHVKIGFKGLKDESFEINDSNFDDSSQLEIINLLDESKPNENKHDYTNTSMASAIPEEEK